MINEIIERIIVERNKMVDSMVLGEIQKMATENGIETKIILDEKTIVSALKKQIPEKVKVKRWMYTQCECGYEFSKHHGDGFYSIPVDKMTNYCPNCGQALEWGE